MLFIVHPNYEQDRLDAVISSVQKEITSLGGTILKTDNWGKRKLAYLINKQRYGSYVLMYFEAEPTLVQGLYEWMEIQSQVLHQMIIRLEEKPELTEESQNPDSPSHTTSRPSAPVKEEKVEKVESASASSSAKATDDKEATADVPEADVVEEVEEEAEEAAEEVVEDDVAEEAVEEPVEDVAEAPVEEADEDVKEGE